MVFAVRDLMLDAYPELIGTTKHVTEVVMAEETTIRTHSRRRFEAFKHRTGPSESSNSLQRLTPEALLQVKRYLQERGEPVTAIDLILLHKSGGFRIPRKSSLDALATRRAGHLQWRVRIQAIRHFRLAFGFHAETLPEIPALHFDQAGFEQPWPNSASVLALPGKARAKQSANPAYQRS